MKKIGTLRNFSAKHVSTGDYILRTTKYQYGGTALIATRPDESVPEDVELVAEDIEFVASVFMEGLVPEDENTIWLKGWSENEGIPEELEGHGVIEFTGKTAQAGFATAHEAVILDSEGWFKGE